jgi:hypothetical protein
LPGRRDGDDAMAADDRCARSSRQHTRGVRVSGAACPSWVIRDGLGPAASPAVSACHRSKFRALASPRRVTVTLHLTELSSGSTAHHHRRLRFGCAFLPWLFELPRTGRLILPDGQITKFVSSPSRKNIPLRATPKSPVYQSPSRPTRGALRGRHERGTGCGGRGGALDEQR